MKTIVALSGLLSLIALTAPAHAVPLVIYTEINGHCEYYATTANHYIYRCENGALEYIRRSTGGGNGGGGGGNGDDPITDPAF